MNEPKSEEYLVKLVGNSFREAGRAILPILPEGTPLILDPEPDNPYDADAIKVLVDMTGHKYSPVPNGPIVHLGYIPRSRGPNIGTREVHAMIQEPHWEASLTFDMTGDPMIRITLNLNQ